MTNKAKLQQAIIESLGDLYHNITIQGGSVKVYTNRTLTADQLAKIKTLFLGNKLYKHYLSSVKSSQINAGIFVVEFRSFVQLRFK